MVKFIGYGGGRGLPQEHLLWPATGRAVLVMDTRGQGSSWSRGDTPDPVGLVSGASGLHDRAASTTRSDYYYRRVYTDGGAGGRRGAVAGPRPIRTSSRWLAAARAVASRSLWPGSHPGVKAAMPDVPFLQRFPACSGAHHPRPLWRNRALSRGASRQGCGGVPHPQLLRRRAFRVARRKAAALFSVALMDDVCPPSTVYGAYNA
ncbi:MAG: acetylxylan esterase [Rubrivivax sp.]